LDPPEHPGHRACPPITCTVHHVLLPSCQCLVCLVCLRLEWIQPAPLAQALLGMPHRERFLVPSVPREAIHGIMGQIQDPIPRQVPMGWIPLEGQEQGQGRKQEEGLVIASAVRDNLSHSFLRTITPITMPHALGCPFHQVRAHLVRAHQVRAHQVRAQVRAQAGAQVRVYTISQGHSPVAAVEVEVGPLQRRVSSTRTVR
jgi:hypothetical protein